MNTATTTTTLDISRYCPTIDARFAVDETIRQPIEIHLGPTGTALAVYDGEPDEQYADLDSLLDAHTLDSDHLVAWLSGEGHEEQAQKVALRTAEAA
jgi:hypothetical protein